MSSFQAESLLQTGLFVLISYIRIANTKLVNIPTDIAFIILKFIAFDTLLECQLHFINTMIKLQQYKTANVALTSIRKTILLYGCPGNDIISEIVRPNQGTNDILKLLSKPVPTIRKNEDTLRGKLWKLLIGLSCINAKKYQNHIQKGAVNKVYVKIRGDTKRTFLTSEAYHSRVSETRVVRVLNSFVHETRMPYISAGDAIVGVLLYVMPELDAYESYLLLMHNCFPTYFYSCNCQSHSRHQLIGSYAASYLAWDILRIGDGQLFQHLQALPALTYFFPLVASFQTICQPFTEIPKLWDFLFCFGFHLGPVMAAAHIIVNKQQILLQTPGILLQGLLSQRKWMQRATNSKAVINCSMKLIVILKESDHGKLWDNILHHCTDLNVAISIRNEHNQGQEIQMNCNVNQTTNESEKNANKNEDLLSINVSNKGMVNECKHEYEDCCESEVSSNDVNSIATHSGTEVTEATEDEESSSSTSSSAWSWEPSDGSNDILESSRIIKRYRFRNLNEFELQDEEIEMFNLCQQTHNQAISEYHAGFTFVDIHCMNDEIIKHWKKHYYCI